MRWEDYFPESVMPRATEVSQPRTRRHPGGGFGPYGLNGNVRNYLGAFGPRVGIAYQLRPKTVVRIGYGRSFDIGVFGSNFGHAVTQNLPVLVHQAISAHDLNPAAINDNVPLYNMSGLNGLPNQPTSAASAFGCSCRWNNTAARTAKQRGSANSSDGATPGQNRYVERNGRAPVDIHDDSGSLLRRE